MTDPASWPTGREIVLELPTDLGSIEHAVEYVIDRCEACANYAHRFKFNFRVSLAEALSNAMMYGNGFDPEKRVRVEVTVRDGAVTARITDQGCGFDPSCVPDPTAPENLLKVGGRGLFLMRNLLDEVRFNDQGNSITLILKLEEASGLEGGVQA